MAPPKRRASIVAEATNRRIAAEAEALMSGSNESSPLTSAMGETPSPPSGLRMGLGMEMERGGRGRAVGSLVQQIQSVRREGLEVRTGEGGLTVSGRDMGKAGSGHGNGGTKKMLVSPRTPTNAGADGKTGFVIPNKSKGMAVMAPPSTPTNGARNRAKEGSTQEKLKVKEGMLPPRTPARGSGSGALQKRSSSAYLENAPDSVEQEREHERPAKRQWRISMPPPFQTPPMMQQNQPQPRKVLGDPAPFALTGPSYTGDPGHADLSNFLGAEMRRKKEPSKLELFSGLPQYPVSRPGPQNAAYAPRGSSSTDSLGTATKHLKVLEELKRQGFLISQGRIESHRLHTQFVKLMGDQRRDMFIRNNRPTDTEYYISRQPPTPDFKHLALGKLKPARNRADPALFGTWHNSKPMHEEDSQGCTFCMFNCDFGVSDERVWLPIEASGGFCRACHEATMDSYHEVEHLLDGEVINDLGHEVQERLDGLSIAAATPPLKELGDKMKFKEVATTFMSERTKASESPQIPGRVDGVGSRGEQQQQVMKAFNAASASRSPSPLRSIAAASPQLPTSGFAGTSPRQQQQAMMANSHSSIENHNPSPQVWSAFLSGLAPQQQQFMLMHINSISRDQASQIIQGSARSSSLQDSMLNDGGAVNISFQRRISNEQVVPISSRAEMNGNGAPNTQTGRAVNGPGGSPLMQPSMLIDAHSLNQRERRLSNSSSIPAHSRIVVSRNGTQSSQQNGGSINCPGGSPRMEISILNDAQILNQRRLSNGSNLPTLYQMDSNSSRALDSERNRRSSNGVVGSSAAIPRARNGAGSPLMEGPMLNGTANADNVNQRRLSNSGSRLAPLQITTNGNGPSKMQQVSLINTESSIALTRSGGVIAPTSIPDSTGAASTKNSRSQPNASDGPASTNATIAQQRFSNLQKMSQSIIGPSGIPPSRNAVGIPTATDLRLNLSGSSPGEPVKAIMRGEGNTNPQRAERNLNGNPPTLKAGPLMMNGVPSSMPQQHSGRKLSNPPLTAPPGSWAATPRKSPFGPAPPSSPILAFSNSHSHPDPCLHRSKTAPLTLSDPMGPPPCPNIQRTVSAIDGRETTIYQGLLFCRGSSWRQVDIQRARICEECKEEKFSIAKHRHTKFHLLCEKRGLRQGEGIGWGGVMGREGKKSGCMVCTEMATYGCEGCPLKLCVGCEVNLTKMCKGHLNNLIYMHGDRAHIRNDAFLLRNDGGGY